jgi:hypothetical protein
VTTIQYSISSADQQALYNMINDSDSTVAEATASTDPADGAPPVYLTPDALMTYCQTRLSGIDSQISMAMTEQQNINWEQSDIQGLLTDLSNDSATAGSGVMQNPTECKNLEQEFENVITSIQAKDPNSSALPQLELAHDTLMATGSGPFRDSSGVLHGYYNGGDPTAPPTGYIPPPNVNNDQDGAIGSNEFTNLTNALTNINSSLGSGAELQMINIQSLMSQRTTAIQLTTNILQAYDDGLSKVADNIGK